jgi:hypothetical protein
MIKMLEIYEFGRAITFLVLGAVWFCCVLMQVFCSVKDWINDDSFKAVGVFKGHFDESGFLAMCSFLAILVIWIIAMIWPISIPLAIASLIIYYLREFIRFKKKIKTALDDKSDVGHEHG